MKKTREMLAAGTLAAALALGGPGVAQAASPHQVEQAAASAEGKVHLVVPHYSQGYNECGPTALRMAMEAVGTRLNQQQIIAVARDVGVGSFDPTTRINPVAMSPDAMTATAQRFGLNVEGGEGKNWGDIYNWLNRGMPVIVDMVYDPREGSFGHFVVVVGMDLSAGTIKVNDSLFGGMEVTYNQATFQYLWNGPVDTGDPLDPNGHRDWAIAIGGTNNQVAANYAAHMEKVVNAPVEAAPEPQKVTPALAKTVAAPVTTSSPVDLSGKRYSAE